jgi:two-component system nitrate/nitrite response regulator NarL
LERNTPTLIIDPIILFREGLRRILYEAGFQPVWCSDSAPIGPIPALSDEVTPLLILGSPVEEAIVQVAAVKRIYPSCRLVLLLDEMSRNEFAAAFRCGLNTFVLRRTSCEALIGTLKLVLGGSTVLPSNLLDAFLEDREEPVAIRSIVPPEISCGEPASIALPLAHGLSARELAVLRWLRDGLPNKEIARRLGITEATVKVHVKALLRKARVKNRTQVAMWATRLEPKQVTQIPDHEYRTAKSPAGN